MRGNGQIVMVDTKVELGSACNGFWRQKLFGMLYRKRSALLVGERYTITVDGVVCVLCKRCKRQYSNKGENKFSHHEREKRWAVSEVTEEDNRETILPWRASPSYLVWL